LPCDLNIKIMSQTKRVIASRVQGATNQLHYRWSASLRKSSTISLDCGRTDRYTACLSRGRFRSERLLEKCSKRVPLVLGLSADVKNWCTKILTRRDLSNSLLQVPARWTTRVFSLRFFSLQSFSFFSISISSTYAQRRGRRKKRFYGGVLGFKMIGVKLG